MTPGDRLRDDRDAIKAKIEALEDEHAALLDRPDSDGVRRQLDAISDRIGQLEADLFDIEAKIASVDPEPRIYGHDGL